jgi:hypothetical protein
MGFWGGFLDGAGRAAGERLMGGRKVTVNHKKESIYSSGKTGCYIATAVYGSYDCPQVWTLRRYRDCFLAKSWFGRAFIHVYYVISPTLVKWVGQNIWFNKFWRNILDRKIKNLWRKGIEDSPYDDYIREK